MLKATGADFVQTDSKGCPGYTSWFSQTPGATVGPGIDKDALLQWRAATKKLGLPLHAHYSGLWDFAAGLKHPSWCVQSPDGKRGSVTWNGVTVATSGRMCPRGPYVDKLMIPQMIEMIDRYDIDGFWVDADVWGATPCYCARCRAAFTASTGIAEPPTEVSDPNWAAWWNFIRESFEAYVTHYVTALHEHKPGVLVCSNWLQTFHTPGPPTVPTDWISGDNYNEKIGGVESARCEARFISTRGKPWDIMMWCFFTAGSAFSGSEWTSVMKPLQMLQQEAALVLAFGGNVQVCENPFGGVRTGQLIPWRIKRIGELSRFVKARRALCQDAETIPQIVVLNSESHVRATPTGSNLHGDADVTAAQGAVFSLLECSYGVDLLDEWALLPRLADFPVVVAAEQDYMSEEMVVALKRYVEAGGKLLVTGAQAFERFGKAFLGVNAGKLVDGTIYHVPAGEGAVPIFSASWRLVKPGTAQSLAPLGTLPFLDQGLLPHPAATVNRVGKGAVAYIPGNVFRAYNSTRYPLLRDFVHEVVRALAGRLEIEVQAPACVDVVLRQKGARKIVHLLNRASGLLSPNLPNSRAVDEIPPVGPVTLQMKLPQKPKQVSLAFEKAPLQWEYVAGGKGGKLKVVVSAVHIHAAVVVE